MLLNGDCLEYLKKQESSSIDSLVTDPPAGIAFMGKDWDKDKGGRDAWIVWMKEIMEECLRVLKPGAHGLVWALPRTSHWTATALENAGFEVRDVICHIFGSGFPKNHDVSKAIDKLHGVKGESYVDHEFMRRNPGKKLDGIDRKKEYSGTEFKEGIEGATRNKPGSDDAKKWEGFGTAIKPSNEHWILVRKPLEKKLTVAKNVLKHGTGAINIDASRIEGAFTSGWSKSGSKGGDNLSMSGKNYDREPKPDNPNGRFPANTIVDESAVAELDEQSGVLKSGKLSPSNNVKKSTGWSGGSQANRVKNTFEPNQGGASRFFYCPKASKRDKGHFNTHPTCKNTKLMEYLITLVTPPGGIVLDPFMGSGSTGVAAIRKGFKFVGIERETEYYDIAKKRIPSSP